jgi:hypothetical protein
LSIRTAQINTLPRRRRGGGLCVDELHGNPNPPRDRLRRMDKIETNMTATLRAHGATQRW